MKQHQAIIIDLPILFRAVQTLPGALKINAKQALLFIQAG